MLREELKAVRSQQHQAGDILPVLSPQLAHFLQQLADAVAAAWLCLHLKHSWCRLLQSRSA